MTAIASATAPTMPPAPDDAADVRARRVAPPLRRALLTAIAAACALVPWIAVVGGSWDTVAVIFIAVISAALGITRLLGGRILAPVVALVIATAWLTLATAPAEALAGIVPTRESLARSFEVLQEGAAAVLYSPRAPIPGDPGVIALLLIAVLVIVLAIDVALALGVPALAAVPLLLPIVLPMAYRIELDPLRLVPIAAAIAALVVLGDGRPVRPRAIVAGAIAAACALLAPAVLPQPRQADIDWPAWLQGAPGAAGGLGAAAGPPLLSTGIDLGADLQRGAPVRVFDYTPSDGLPVLTRLTALAGIGADGFVEERGELTTEFTDLGGMGAGSTVATEFVLGRALIRNVPLPAQALQTSDFGGTWRWDPAAQSIGFTDPERIVSLNDQAYTVTSIRQPPLPPGTTPDSTGAPEALEVPADAAWFADLAADIVDEGASPRERADQLFAYLTDDTWAYSEEVPLDGFGTEDGGQWSALQAFAEAREGYCVHYASSMAILARAAGIPARVSIGFLPGTDTDADGTYTVTTNDMHAWAELWFDGYGWVPFDTTPSVAAGGTVASAEDEDDAGATEQPTLPSPTASAAQPSAAPSASATPSASASGDAAAAPSASSSTPGIRVPAAVGIALLALLALVVLLVMPLVVRSILRVRRIAEGAGGAMWEVQASLADAGHRVPQSSTPGEIAAAVGALALRPRERAALERLHAAAERHAFGGDAAAASTPEDLGRDARAVVAGIRRTVPRNERLLRTLLPPSLMRVWRVDVPDDDPIDLLR